MNESLYFKTFNIFWMKIISKIKTFCFWLNEIVLSYWIRYKTLTKVTTRLINEKYNKRFRGETLEKSDVCVGRHQFYPSHLFLWGIGHMFISLLFAEFPLIYLTIIMKLYTKADVHLPIDKIYKKDKKKLKKKLKAK